MEERTVQAIPAVPLGLMMGAISAVIGLIIGIIYAVAFGSIMAMIPAIEGFDFGALGILFGVGAIVIVPIVAFIGGLIQGLIIAVIYNFLAPRIGGVKLRFKEAYPPPPQ